MALLVVGGVAAGFIALVVFLVGAVTLLGGQRGGQSGFVPVGQGETTGTTSRFEEVGRGDTTEGAAIPWTELAALEVGDCVVEETGGSGAGSVGPGLELVDCDEPHRSEVFAVEELPDGATFPGEDTVAEVVERLCYGDGFTSYVGRPYQDSALWLTAFYPLGAGWEDGHRDVTCFVHGPEPEEPTTGSLRGTDR